jgi:sigma-B regulation protein RsbU (phosphoserine phosphatase)
MRLIVEISPILADTHTKGYAMNLDSLLRFISSPLVAKLFVEVLAFAVLLHNRKRDLENVTSAMLGVLSLFIIRDVLFQFFPYAEILFISDILAFSSVFFVCSWFYGRKVNALLVALVNLLVLVGFAANLAFPFLPPMTVAMYEIVLIVDLAWFCIFCILNMAKAESIAQLLFARSWVAFAAFTAVYLALTILCGYQNEILQRLLFPAYYCVFFIFAGIHLAVIDAQGQKERDYLTNTIDSIYAFMESSGGAFKNAADMNELLTQINRSIIAETKASGGLIAMVDEFDDILAVKAFEGSFPPPFKLPAELPRKQARIEAFMKHAQFKLGETVFGESAKAGQSVFIPDASRDPRVVINGDEDFFTYSSIMVIPFTVGDKVIGVVALSRSTKQERFSELEFERCRMLADFGTIVIRNLQSAMEAAEKSNIEKEAGIAQDIQKTLTPKKLSDIDKVSFGAFCQPARGVYSDYYDIIHNRSGQVILVMVDVAGKGVQASLIMVMIRALLHLTTNTSKDIATILNWVNRGISGKIEMDHFATLAIIAVDSNTGEAEYANANQQPLVIVRKRKNEVEMMEIESVPIGVERKTEYTSRKFKLESGDFMAVFTDGIPEAMNIQGKQYGKKRISDIIMRNMNQSPKDLAANVRKDLQDFVGQARQHDDQSLLIMKMKT